MIRCKSPALLVWVSLAMTTGSTIGLGLRNETAQPVPYHVHKAPRIRPAPSQSIEVAGLRRRADGPGNVPGFASKVGSVQPVIPVELRSLTYLHMVLKGVSAQGAGNHVRLSFQSVPWLRPHPYLLRTFSFRDHDPASQSHSFIRRPPHPNLIRKPRLYARPFLRSLCTEEIRASVQMRDSDTPQHAASRC